MSRLAASERPLESEFALLDVQQPQELKRVIGGRLGSFSAPLVTDEQLRVWVPQEGNEQGCAKYASRLAPSSVAVVRRGKCTFMEKTKLARQANAKGVIIVSDEEKVIDMGGDNTTKDSDIFALSVKKSDGERFIDWSSSHRSSEDPPLMLKFQYYHSQRGDISEALMIILATSLIVAGAKFSTDDLRAGTPMAPKREEILEVNSEIAIGWCTMGSIMLVVLFFFMAYMIYVITFCFCVGGASCIVMFTGAYLEYYVPSLRHRALSIPTVGPVSRSEVLACVPAVSLVAGWLYFKQTQYGWFFQDIIGAAFLCSIQRVLRLPNMKVATILLSAMFFFDIFWVFLSPFLFGGKSVMVEVAKGGGTQMEVPMLLRIPAIGDPIGSDRMLGFGDIALPGLLCSYLLRHDTLAMPRKRLLAGYFVPSIIGYFAGLVITIVALVVMKMGQPALLYLVPGTLGTTLVLGWRRGDLKVLWEGTPGVRHVGHADCEANGTPDAGTEVGNVIDAQ